MEIAADSSARCHNTFGSLKQKLPFVFLLYSNMICMYCNVGKNRVTEREMGVKMCMLERDRFRARIVTKKKKKKEEQ